MGAFELVRTLFLSDFRILAPPLLLCLPQDSESLSVVFVPNSKIIQSFFAFLYAVSVMGLVLQSIFEFS